MSKIPSMFDLPIYPDDRTADQITLDAENIGNLVNATTYIHQLRAHIEAQDARIAEVKQHNLELAVALAKKATPTDQRLAELEAKADRRWALVVKLAHAHITWGKKCTYGVITDAANDIIKEGL
jgi:hypothetical protein